MKRFNNWLATTLGNGLSSMAFFYFCVVLDLVELGPVIRANDIITWCTYLSQTVIQLIALPVLGAMQKISNDHHEKNHARHDEHASKLDLILKKLP